MEDLKINRLVEDAILPTRAHPDDAGLDLYSLEDVFLPPQSGKAVRTGIALCLPEGHVGLIADRSSLAKKGIKTAGGVIDAGYRGEIQIVFWNLSTQEVSLRKGDRVAQLLIIPVRTPKVQEVPSLDETQRGQKGFGSSGA